MKINLRLYDIDGSLHYKYPNASREDVEDSVVDWLFENNRYFFARHVREINSKQYDKVFVGYGTNRQDDSVDQAMRRHGGTAAPTIPIVQNYFSSKLDCEVKLDPFLLADLYGFNKERVTYPQAGDAYKAILRDRYAKSKENHNEAMLDHSKISLLYAHAHRIAKLHPNDEIDIDFYDDNDRILSGLKSFFEKYPRLLPRNVKLHLHKYDGKYDVSFASPITGQGKIDDHYDWSVRYMSAKNYFFSDSADEDRNIKTAEELKNYHENNHYYYRSHERAMDILMRNDSDIVKFVKEFEVFRDQEAPKLATNNGVTGTANYTTAASLVTAGLLPEKFLVIPPNPNLISDRAHQQIIAIMNQYVASRANIANSNVELSWTSRWIRNSALTERKLAIANNFVKYVTSHKDIKTLQELVTDCLNHNDECETAQRKTYGCFTSSGLLRSLNQVKTVLRDESIAIANAKRERSRMSMNIST